MPRSVLVSVLCVVLGVFTLAPVAAQESVMPVASLREGMKGIGRTVIEGTLIQDFDVEIVGILERGGFNGGPMVLVRGSGPVLNATGGFAGGYSGSPVYIDGKMIGAISAAWYFADHSIAGVTPIEEMFKNFGYPEANEGLVSGNLTPLSEAITLEGQSLDAIYLAQAPASSVEDIAADAAAGVLTLTPCKTPLFVNGLNPELIGRIQKELGPMFPYLDIMPGLSAASSAGYSSATGGTAAVDLFPGLLPGAAVGAQLVAGDIDMTAIGTLTYIDQKNVLAFGHPFMQVGAIELPLTKARIVHTMKSIERSFKMGEAVSLVGTINQDRASGISGVLGQSPKMIPFHLTVRDTDLDRIRRYNYSVVDYESILPFLGMLPPIQGLSEVMDRQGPATIRSHFKIITDKLPPIERTNLFYDQFSGVGFLELVQGLYLLTTQNIFEDVQIQEVVIDVEVTQNRQTSDIIKAEIVGESVHTQQELQESGTTTLETQPLENPEGKQPEPLQSENGTQMQTYEIPSTGLANAGEPVKVHPGESLTIEVHLKPYREAERRERLTISIPRDMPMGQTTIEVRGGGRLPSIFQLAAQGQGIPNFMPQTMGPVAPKPPETLQDLVDEFLKGEKMNELVVELYRPIAGTGPTSLLGEDSGASGEAMQAGVTNPDADSPNASEQEPIKEIQQTDRVIFGSIILAIEVVGEGEQPDDSSENPGKPDHDDTATRESDSPRGSRNNRTRGRY